MPAPQRTQDADRAPGVVEVTALLRELNALRVDPHATDLDWLIFFEHKADLFTRIAAIDGGPAVAEVAAHAREEVDRRRALLDLDPRLLDLIDPDDDEAATGGVSGRW